jgi:glucose-1-phosphate thymidylyltransferase
MAVETAVVLAAGEGTRLRPLTEHRPKPMLPAATRPILTVVLDALVEAGVTDLHVVVGYGRDRVQDAVGATHRGVPVHYHGQAQRLGTGHALLQAAGVLPERFLVVNGDEVVDADLVRAVRETHDGTTPVTLAVVESAEAPRYGAVRLDGDRVTELVEKPGEGAYRFLNVGVYAVEASVLDAVRETPRRDGELRITDAIARLVDGTADAPGGVGAVRSSGPLVTATYPWDLLRVTEHLLAAGRVAEPSRSTGVYVAETAAVHETATLRPPTAVAADAEVGPGAVVGPAVALGRNVTVDSGAVLAHGVVDSDARVGPNVTLVETVLGQAARVGAGVTVPGGPADVRVGTTVHEGERLGAVLADRATVGGGAVVVPGSLVGPGAAVASGATVDGVVSGGTRVVR